KALALDPSFLPAIKVKRWARIAMGDRNGALAAFRSELSYSGGSTDEPGWKIIEAQVGEPVPEAVAALASASNSPAIRDNPFAFAYEIALGYLALGQTAKALTYLEK